jgi:hypothetical protein
LVLAFENLDPTHPSIRTALEEQVATAIELARQTGSARSYAGIARSTVIALAVMTFAILLD